MTTVGDLCAAILHDSGVVGDNQEASATDSQTVFRLLNQMVAQWNRKRWLLYNLIEVSLPTTGQESYSVGPGGDFDTPRPDRLEDGCFLRQLNTGNQQAVDYHLEILPSHEDYARIRLKDMGTWPSCIFYDSGWPQGRVFPWPVPQIGLYELHLLLKNQISQFSGLTQTINLPPEYEAALSYNGQVRTRAAYRLPPDPIIIGLAKDALNTIRGANVQVPTLRMPAALVQGQRAYNVYSDSGG